MKKTIKTLDELQKFVLAVMNAIGEISKDEAGNAIDKAFLEFKTEFKEDWNKTINEVVNDFTDRI